MVPPPALGRVKRHCEGQRLSKTADALKLLQLTVSTVLTNASAKLYSPSDTICDVLYSHGNHCK